MIRLLITGVLLFMTVFRVAMAGDDNSKVLGSVHIAAGQRTGNATTVNGSIEVGENAVIKHAETVNGNITVRAHASAESLKAVNGTARLEEGARVNGAVELVNGQIELAKGAEVTGRVSNVNGAIELVGAHVAGGIETTQGDIDVGADSRIEKGIVVNKPGEGWSSHGSRVPRIVIGPGARVQGEL